MTTETEIYEMLKSKIQQNIEKVDKLKGNFTQHTYKEGVMEGLRLARNIILGDANAYFERIEKSHKAYKVIEPRII